MSDRPSESPMPLRVQFGAIALALAGLVLSLLTVSHHIEVKTKGATTAFCNINATFSCDDVALSAYSEVFGVPTGVYAAGYFVGLLVLVGTIWQRPKYLTEAWQAYRFLVGAGAAVALVLAIISFAVLGKGCLTCIGLYVVLAAQVGLLSFVPKAWAGPWSAKALGNGLSFAAVPLALSLGAYSTIKPLPSDFKQDLPQSEGASSGANALAPVVIPIQVHRSAYSGFGEDYRKGSDEAKVVIVEFADFQCPACQNAAFMLKGLHEEYGDRVQIVFKNYPLDQRCNKGVTQKIHAYACDAAVIARCAGKKGQFFAMHDQIYSQQSSIDPSNLRKWAKDQGLSDTEIDECLKSEDLLAKIREDVAEGDKIGITGTPTLFVNGRKVMVGSGDAGLRRAISAILAE